jgi:hypothetical protein
MRFLERVGALARLLMQARHVLRCIPDQMTAGGWRLWLRYNME